MEPPFRSATGYGPYYIYFETTLIDSPVMLAPASYVMDLRYILFSEPLFFFLTLI